jgi:type IV pilus assembly protein PilO
MSGHGMTLARRVFAEHRRTILPLASALVVNLLVYGFFVYPLAQRVANVEQRNQEAEQGLIAARADFTQAYGTLTGKDRASTELATFYNDVLPEGLSAARRMTQLRLNQLARESGLRFERESYEEVADRDSSLKRLRIRMVLSGDYDELRTFVHQMETASEFVVIDNVELSEGADRDGSLVVTLEMSTYFREGA